MTVTADAAGLRRKRQRQTLLALAGVALLVGLIAASGAGAVLRALQDAGWRALAVVAAHLPSVICAAMGWRVLLAPAQQPGLPRTLLLRWIKESVNALLPVAQVGGDVVRARLAAGPKLPLVVATASCLVDVGLGVAGLAIFATTGVAAAFAIHDDAQLTKMGLELAGAAAVITLALTAAERLGALRMVERVALRAGGAFGELSTLGDEVRLMLARRRRIAASIGWHLMSWGCGVFETSVAMWAVGITPSLELAFVLESLAQAVRAVGFAVPGALGVQEGGYLLLCASLGIPAEKGLALALIRRLRELVLGGAGLLAWRWLAAARARMAPAPH